MNLEEARRAYGAGELVAVGGRRDMHVAADRRPERGEVRGDGDEWFVTVEVEKEPFSVGQPNTWRTVARRLVARESANGV